MSRLILSRSIFVIVQVATFAALGALRPREFNSVAFYVFNAFLAILASVWIIRSDFKQFSLRALTASIFCYLLSALFFTAVFLRAYSKSVQSNEVSWFQLISSNVPDFIGLALLSATTMFCWLAIIVSTICIAVYHNGARTRTPTVP